jgi:hypothetical protein
MLDRAYGRSAYQVQRLLAAGVNCIVATVPCCLCKLNSSIIWQHHWYDKAPETGPVSPRSLDSELLIIVDGDALRPFSSE